MPACGDLNPWDVIRWRGVKAVWRNQDFGIVGPRIRVPVTLVAAGQSLQLAGTAGGMFGDVNILAWMPTDARYWLVFRAIRLQLRTVETQPLLSIERATDGATVSLTPKAGATYVHSLGIDAIGSNYAIPSYGPAAPVGALGGPVALQPNWRQMAGWQAVDMESDSFIFTQPASAALVDNAAFLDFEGWAVKKEDVKDHNVKLGKGALSRYFQEGKAMAREQILKAMRT